MTPFRAELNPHEVAILNSWSQVKKPIPLPLEIRNTTYEVSISARPHQEENLDESQALNLTQIYLILVKTPQFNGSISILHDKANDSFFFQHNEVQTHLDIPTELMLTLLESLHASDPIQAPITIHQQVA